MGAPSPAGPAEAMGARVIVRLLNTVSAAASTDMCATDPLRMTLPRYRRDQALVRFLRPEVTTP